MCPIPPRKRRGASSTVSRPFRFGERGHTCARRRRLRRLRKEKAECVLPADSLLNKIPTAYEKKSFDLWIEEGLLLGYDAEKGPLIVPSNHRSNSRRSVGVGDQVTPPNGTKKSPSPKPAVYRNQTSVGDIYQNAGPLGANDHPRADERVVISLGVSIQEAP